MLDVQQLRSSFWNPKFWLPSGLQWEDVQPKDGYDHTSYHHLYLCPIPFALVVFLCRLLLYKYGFIRLGLALGMKNIKSKRAPPNPVLEKAYKINSKWTHKDMVSLSKQTDCTERKIERWLRLRKIQDKPSTIHKFSECCWRFSYFSQIFLYGISNLWMMPWLRNLNDCWTNYPHQELSSEIWWYYMISFAFYISLLVTQMFNNKRRDLWPTFLQNIIMISLLLVSWITNLYRITIVILLLHDISEALMQGWKASKYAKSLTVGTYLIYVFFVTWILARLLLFPFWILHNTLFKVPTILSFPAYHYFNGILILLFCINLYKTYLLVHFVMKYFSTDKFDGDNDSNSSEERDR